MCVYIYIYIYIHIKCLRALGVEVGARRSLLPELILIILILLLLILLIIMIIRRDTGILFLALPPR